MLRLAGKNVEWPTFVHTQCVRLVLFSNRLTIVWPWLAFVWHTFRKLHKQWQVQFIGLTKRRRVRKWPVRTCSGRQDNGPSAHCTLRYLPDPSFGPSTHALNKQSDSVSFYYTLLDICAEFLFCNNRRTLYKNGTLFPRLDSRSGREEDVICMIPMGWMVGQSAQSPWPVFHPIGPSSFSQTHAYGCFDMPTFKDGRLEVSWQIYVFEFVLLLVEIIVIYVTAVCEEFTCVTSSLIIL